MPPREFETSSPSARPDDRLVATHQPLVTTSLADEIAFRLQAAIVDGTYRPGMQLRQEEICQQFNVSRTPVREALRKLQAQHLIVMVPNKGALVRSLARREVKEIYELRAELEGFACELAVAVITPAAIAELQKAQDAVETATAELELRPRDTHQGYFYVPLIRANDRFHQVIHDVAGNDLLQTTLAHLQSSFPKDLVWRAVRSVSENRGIVIEEHMAVLDALRNGNGPGSRKLMAHHVRHSADVLLAYLDEHDFWKT